jgi:ABC-type antimicrobial peptide transport system permease subunit
VTISFLTLLLSHELRKLSSKYPAVHELVFTGIGANGSGTDIRVPIRGIVSYNRLKMFNLFTAIDIQSYRRCMGYDDTTQTSAPFSTKDSVLLNASNAALDTMFGGNTVVGLDEVNATSYTNQTVDFGTSDANLNLSKITPSDADDGAYNILSVILTDQLPIAAAVKSINETLTEKNCHARALPWTRATGTIGDLVKILKLCLFVSVLVLYIVAIILFINTLVMNVLERKAEVAMIRALGAQKRFVVSLFGCETAFLAGLSGCLGIIAGVIIVTVIRIFDCIPTNIFLEALFGAERLRPVLSLTDLLLVALQLAIMIIISASYPMVMARKIQPIDVMMDAL